MINPSLFLSSGCFYDRVNDTIFHRFYFIVITPFTVAPAHNHSHQHGHHVENTTHKRSTSLSAFFLYFIFFLFFAAVFKDFFATALPKSIPTHRAQQQKQHTFPGKPSNIKRVCACENFLNRELFDFSLKFASQHFRTIFA